jgi:hypothetical protein
VDGRLGSAAARPRSNVDRSGLLAIAELLIAVPSPTGRVGAASEFAADMVSGFSAALAAIFAGNLFHAGYVPLPLVLSALPHAVGVFCWLRVDVTRTLADPA